MPGNEIEDICRLTPLQKGMLFHWIYDKQASTYFLQQTYLINGNIDEAACRLCLDHLSQQYEVLRTAFIHEDLDEPLQVVLKSRKIEFSVRKADGESSLEALKAADRQRGFDLTEDPLMRVMLVILPAGNALVWSFHHIILDGWSIALLISDFLSCYQRLANGQLPVAANSRQYKTFLKWLEKQQPEEGRLFWRNYLSGYDTVADISPLKQSSATAATFNRLRKTLGSKLTKYAETMAAAEGTTVNLVLQAIWGILLAKYNNCRDVVFGQVVSGRPYELEDVEKMVGLFVNTVPFRVAYSQDDTFSGVLKKLNQYIPSVYQHQHVPLIDIFAQNDLKQQLFTHLWVFENYAPGNPATGSTALTVTGTEIFEQTNFDLTLTIWHEAEITIQFDYREEKYPGLLMESVFKHFMHILEAVGQHVNIPVVEISLLDDDEKKKMAAGLNQSEWTYPRDITLMELLKLRAVAFPAHTAVISEHEKLSYAGLDQASDRVANYLISKGAGRNKVVAVMLDRSPEMLIWIYGILKTGAAYLPVNTKLPQGKVEFLLKDSEAVLLVTRQHFKQSIDKMIETVLLDDDPHLAFSTDAPGVAISRNDLMYVMYTSGSTGDPKGVMVEHQSVVNLLYGLDRIFPFTEDDVYLVKTPYYFDVSVPELFGFFINAPGKAVLMGPGEEKDPYLIVSYIHRYKVTHINFVPSLFNLFAMICTQEYQEFRHLKNIFLAGEALSGEHVNKFHRLYETVKLVNAYGPTECCVYAGYYLINTAQAGAVPIGRPLDNVQLWITDTDGQLQPVGVAGELCISGAGLARGYVNNEKETSRRFIPNLLPAPDRVYRTGDLARRLPDGNVEYIGRVDRQLKIRGNRVEPGEIEYAMLAAPGISDACVVFREDILCGYYTSATAVEESFLRAYLSGELADYMVPGVLMRLDSFPLTGSGKKDVQALPSPLSFTDNLFRAPSGETEQQVAAVWAATLGREQIGATANFFSLGGDSIKAIQVMSRLRSQGYSVSMKNIFDYPTVEGLALQVRKVTGEATQETITGRDSQGPPQFTYGELSQENIGNICKEYPVDDLYRLSGIQEGMLFHWLYDPHSNAYFQQFSYLLKGSIDRDRMWDTLHRLVEKHDSLRTVFLYKGLQQPVQAVLTTLPPLISFRDVSAQVALEGKRKVVEQYRQADRRQPFVPDSGPLIRFALLQLATDQYELIWSFHHIIMDGWCINLLVKDFLDIYQQYGKWTAPETDTPQYKNYLNWLDKGNKEEMRSFWKAYFEGYSTNSSSILSAYADLPCGKEEQSCRHLVVSTEQSVQLKSLCRKMQLTPSMVIQALWGILLGKYGNCGDVVFGLVVSGRPPELPQADVIVGLFINTVPLRITFNNNMSFAALFEAVKKQAGDITLYQYTPLPEIREMISAGTAPMFDHTLVFEDFGYQLPADWKEAGFEMLAGELFEQTNYMLDVSVHTVNEISFKFTYDPSQLTDSLVKNLISDLSGLIDKVIENPQQPVGDFGAGNGSAEKHSNLFSDIRF